MVPPPRALRRVRVRATPGSLRVPVWRQPEPELVKELEALLSQDVSVRSPLNQGPSIPALRFAGLRATSGAVSFDDARTFAGSTPPAKAALHLRPTNGVSYVIVEPDLMRRASRRSLFMSEHDGPPPGGTAGNYTGYTTLVSLRLWTMTSPFLTLPLPGNFHPCHALRVASCPN